MNYKKYFVSAISCMLDSNDMSLRQIAEKIRMDALKDAVYEEFEYELNQVQEASEISPESATDKINYWFRMDIGEFNLVNDDMLAFILSVTYSDKHKQFLTEYWDNINEIYQILYYQCNEIYLESRRIKDIDESFEIEEADYEELEDEFWGDNDD